MKLNLTLMKCLQVLHFNHQHVVQKKSNDFFWVNLFKGLFL